MASKDAGKESMLIKKAAKLELKEIENKKIAPSQMQALEALLQDTYLNHRPKLSDYHLRRDLVKTFNVIAKDTYGNSNDFPVVEAFGSFIMDMFSAQSDLDLSINFSKNEVELPRDHKIRVLRKIAKKLYNLQAKGEMSNVKPIMTAKVPIVKVTDRGTGIECDISVENWDGMARSHILNLISAIDERFKKLSLLMKDWAKAHKINSSRDRTLNSLSIVSLVTFHLQTRDPPILPPLSAIFRDGTDPVSVKRTVKTFLNYGDKNKETLAELFFTLLVKLASVELLWPKGLCASTYKGSWMVKTWGSGVGCISVEDFLERSQNVARAVKTDQVAKIYMCIRGSLSHILTFKDGRIEQGKLIELLFGLHLNVPQKGKGTKKSKRKAVDRLIRPDSIQTKRHIKGGWGGGSHTNANTAALGGWGGGGSQTNANTAAMGGWGGGSQIYANATTIGGWGPQTYANTAAMGGWGSQPYTNTAAVGGWGGGSQTCTNTAAKGGWGGSQTYASNTAAVGSWGGKSQTYANDATKGGWGEPQTYANTATSSMPTNSFVPVGSFPLQNLLSVGGSLNPTKYIGLGHLQQAQPNLNPQPGWPQPAFDRKQGGELPYYPCCTG